MKRKRLLCRFTLIIIALYLGSDILIANWWRTKASEREIYAHAEKINKCPVLPDIVIDAYETSYPGATNQNLIPDVIWLMIHNDKMFDPKMQAFYLPFASSSLKLFSIANKAEEKTTGRKCIEYVLSKQNFGNGIIGIKSAANYYYNKNLHELNKEECIQLVFCTKKPTCYHLKKQ